MSNSQRSMIMPWVPLVWEPIYEQMVALHIAGWSYQTIGNHLGYGSQQVGNIIRSPEAQNIKDAYTKQIRSQPGSTLSELRDVATKRIAEVLNSDEIAEKAPFRMFDAAAKLLSGVGALRAESDTTVNNTFMLSPDGEDKLIAAIQKSDEAKRLNAGPINK